MRRLYNRYVREGGLLGAFRAGDVHLNWKAVARLAELAYRCNLCRRCAHTCPIGVDNYCCGGGSGFAIMSPHNFADWRHHVSGRKKLQQILNAFADCRGPQTPKYVCAPCSNCKGQIRDILAYYGLWEKERILYGGLVELIVNAMEDAKPGFIEWEWR